MGLLSALVVLLTLQPPVIYAASRVSHVNLL